MQRPVYVALGLSIVAVIMSTLAYGRAGAAAALAPRLEAAEQQAAELNARMEQEAQDRAADTLGHLRSLLDKWEAQLFGSEG